MDTADIFFKAVGLDRPEFERGSIFFLYRGLCIKMEGGMLSH